MDAFGWICLHLVLATVTTRDTRANQYCYDCNYAPTGYVKVSNGSWVESQNNIFSYCGLGNHADPSFVNKWVCSSGKCYVRKDKNGLVFRGCADSWNLPWGVDSERSCESQGHQQSLWLFCDGDLCNSADIELECGDDGLDHNYQPPLPLPKTPSTLDTYDYDYYQPDPDDVLVKLDDNPHSSDETVHGQEFVDQDRFLNEFYGKDNPKSKSDYQIGPSPKKSSYEPTPKISQALPRYDQSLANYQGTPLDGKYRLDSNGNYFSRRTGGVIYPSDDNEDAGQGEHYEYRKDAYGGGYALPGPPTRDGYNWWSYFLPMYPWYGSAYKPHSHPSKSHPTPPQVVQLVPQKSYPQPKPHQDSPMKSHLPSKMYEPTPQKSHPPEKSHEPAPKKSHPSTKTYEPAPQKSHPQAKTYAPASKNYQPLPKTYEATPKKSPPPPMSYEHTSVKSHLSPKSHEPSPQKSHPPTKSYQSPPIKSQPLPKSYQLQTKKSHPPPKSYKSTPINSQPPPKSYQPIKSHLPPKSYQPLPKKSHTPPKSYQPPPNKSQVPANTYQPPSQKSHPIPKSHQPSSDKSHNSYELPAIVRYDPPTKAEIEEHSKQQAEPVSAQPELEPAKSHIPVYKSHSSDTSADQPAQTVDAISNNEFPINSLDPSITDDDEYMYYADDDDYWAAGYEDPSAGYYENAQYNSYSAGLQDPCTGDCFDNPSGLFAHPNSQGRFIQCVSGMDGDEPCVCCRPIYHDCPQGTTFDELSKVCSLVSGGAFETPHYKSVEIDF